MTKRTGPGRRAAVLLGVAVALSVAILPGCGGTTKPTQVTASPTPPPSPPPSVIVTGSGGLGIRLLAMIPFTSTTAGRLDATVDWTFAANDVDVYLVRGACTFEQFIADQCTVVAFSESLSAKPEKISAPGAAAGAYMLLIGNRGPGEESVAYQVVLSPSAASTASMARAAHPNRIRSYFGVAAVGRE